MSKKRALIIGITGQDGSYLSRLLLSKGYEVHGLRRRSSSFNTERIDELIETGEINLHYGDLTDPSSLTNVILSVKPEEIYNLGAQSHVAVSFLQPDYTSNVDGLGTLRILEAVKMLGLDSKIYQASTSELFGDIPGPQNESTKFSPQSPYAVAKNFAFEMSRLYRDAYGLFVSNGILFNHESPMRGRTFVTKKITHGLAQFLEKGGPTVELGNLDAKRDWGHARDYVESQWLMLQQEVSDDFVVATGFSQTVRSFCETACMSAGVNLHWEGEGDSEMGYLSDGRVAFSVSPKYYRPLEVPFLLGDATKAKNILGWEPKTSFNSLVEEMMQYDLAWARGHKENLKWLN
jgi:GDPmannose 4,6-dehydratase